MERMKSSEKALEPLQLKEASSNNFRQATVPTFGTECCLS